jgi:hypothetical protein
LPRKCAVLTALALSAVVGSAGAASAHDNNTHVHGGNGFSSSPVVVSAPQQGVLIVNGTLVDGRCAALLADDAGLDVDLGRGAQAVGCNTGKIEQTSFSRGGLLSELL